MRVCVVGSGGREHALAMALSRSADVMVTPGNPGIPGSTPVPPEEIEADLYVIGPEVPLVAGLADRLRAAGKLVFGPGADGAQLEGSKSWMKDTLAYAGVPTARYGTFSDVDAALAFLRTLPGLYVVKTDGLAAGKGVFVTESLPEAEADVREKLAGRSFGEAGRRVVIEEGMTGPELSLLALCDGTRAVALESAQDHKRVGDGDVGPNTGGMGAYSPVPDLSVSDAEILDVAVLPTLKALSGQGIDYRGVLYAGMMLTPEGPKVVEFNVRFGDPETQVVLPRWEGDVAAILAEAAAGRLVSEPSFTPQSCVCVVLCSEGYPAAPRTGDAITGIQDAEQLPGVAVFHAGTAAGDDGGVVTAGGRVLNVSALAPSLREARNRAYEAAGKINWPGIHFRHDIAAVAAEEDT